LSLFKPKNVSGLGDLQSPLIFHHASAAKIYGNEW